MPPHFSYLWFLIEFYGGGTLPPCLVVLGSLIELGSDLLCCYTSPYFHFSISFPPPVTKYSHIALTKLPS